MDLMYFEDIRKGDILDGVSHQVSREEIINFAKEFDPQPFHIDESAANKSPFGGLTASGAHTMAIQIKLIFQRVTKYGRPYALIARLGWDEVRFKFPVRPDDLLSLRMECVEARESESKPDRGIVRWYVTLENQNGEVVLSNYQSVIISKRKA